jgi:hypothetical protein
MKSTLKRLLGLALAAVMLFSAVPTQTLTVTANPEPVVRLPEVALGQSGDGSLIDNNDGSAII